MSAKALLSASVSAPPAVYVEDVFSTFLYTGNGSTQTIENGIALGDNVINYLTGRTITNIGSAIILGSLSNVNDGILETVNGANYAYTSGTLDIYVDMGAGFAATGYLIASQGTTNNVVYNNIDGFIVKASNDAYTWTTIQTFSGYDSTYPAWNAGSFRPFTFTNSTAYRYWRLQSTDVSNDSLSEWALLSNSPGAGEGGLVWIKNRGLSSNNFLFDTLRGAGNYLRSNQDSAEGNFSPLFSSFNANGFSLNGASSDLNSSSYNYASWTFREAPKFFDVVTYTGDGNASKTISHNLGSTPGFLIVKRTNSTGQWQCYHRSLTSTNYYIQLNQTSGQQTVGAQAWDVSSTNFTVYGAATDTNINNATYVAYVFAHDAGGFGDAGTDNVVSCGSVVGSSNAEVYLGWEPQWILVKNATSTQDWWLVDNMRGLSSPPSASRLNANLSTAETTGLGIGPTATGFQTLNLLSNGQTYIYIAIRRGPMKTPESGTEVYYPFARSGNDTETTVTGVGFSPDLWMVKSRNTAAAFPFFDRLRGVTRRVNSTSTYLEETFSGSNGLVSLNMNGITIGAGAFDGGICNDTGTNYANWLLKRAPGFFDVVAYTGTGTTQNVKHNLGVAPQIIINKSRSADANFGWPVYAEPLGNGQVVRLNEGDATGGSGGWGTTSPTATQFTVNGYNNNSVTYIAYLFATCPGVSKVGSYTGTGTGYTVDVNCGFTTGARFVLIKRTDSTGDWFVWDTARGIISGNDPYLLLNSTAAEVTGTDYIDPLSTGFQISSTAPAAINANGGTYIFLAIS